MLEPIMDVFEAIRGRRSIRNFGKGDVVSEDLRQMLEAAISAPSAGNLQPWEFVIVRSADTKIALAEAAYGQNFIAQAPVVIVICANVARSATRYRERGRDLYSIQDTAAAAQNILLASYAMGYGSCWVGAFDETKVARIVNVPEDVRPLAIIPVGRSTESPEPRPKYNLEKVTHVERFN